MNSSDALDQQQQEQQSFMRRSNVGPINLGNQSSLGLTKGGKFNGMTRAGTVDLNAMIDEMEAAERAQKDET